MDEQSLDIGVVQRPSAGHRSRRARLARRGRIPRHHGHGGPDAARGQTRVRPRARPVGFRVEGCRLHLPIRSAGRLARPGREACRQVRALLGELCALLLRPDWRRGPQPARVRLPPSGRFSRPTSSRGRSPCQQSLNSPASRPAASSSMPSSRAASRSGSVTVITGEPGVGKTVARPADAVPARPPRGRSACTSPRSRSRRSSWFATCRSSRSSTSRCVDSGHVQFIDLGATLRGVGAEAALDHGRRPRGGSRAGRRRHRQLQGDSRHPARVREEPRGGVRPLGPHGQLGRDDHPRRRVHRRGDHRASRVRDRGRDHPAAQLAGRADDDPRGRGA